MVVAGEDAAAITVEGDGDAVALQEALEQVEIALGGFGREEVGGEDFAGGIVLHAQGGEAWAAAFEPVVGRAIELDEFTFASRTQTALTMSGRTAFAWWADAVGAEQAAQGFAAEGEAFVFDELLVEMMIVEAGVARVRESEDAVACALGQATVAGSAAADVRQSRCAALPITRFKPFDMPRREVEQLRGSGARQVPLQASRNDGHSLQFLLTQRECLLSHGVTFSRCR